ncbi:MAG: redoxin domain-containing protein [Pleurocapsa sp. SU_196_0]|nr:redoxin domain-containing protein [Pleurocapsa sp. SU_196_0]
MNPTLRKLLIPAVISVLFVGLIASLLRPAEPGNTSTALLEGKPAPAFTLVNLNGGTVNLESYKGKPIVLNFFASWCVPCKDEAPMLSQAAQDLGIGWCFSAWRTTTRRTSQGVRRGLQPEFSARAGRRRRHGTRECQLRVVRRTGNIFHR